MTPFKGTNRITSPFGWRTYKNAAGVTVREHHNGIDLVPTKYSGEAVDRDAWLYREVTGGDVVEVSTGWNGGRGTLVRVQTAPGVIQIYQHNAENLVRVGQHVPQGTILARAGGTGNVTGDHLHFEVQINGAPVEPSAWLGLPNAAGTYPGNDTLDSTPAEDTENAPANDQLHTIQLVTIGPLTAAQMQEVAALAAQQGLSEDRYKAMPAGEGYQVAVLSVSSGDAMQYMTLAQRNGWDKLQRYDSRFVG